MNKRLIAALIAVIILVAASVTACTLLRSSVKENEKTVPSGTQTDEAYIKVNGNVPRFSEEEKKNAAAFESYSDLDALGRCGVAFACVGKETMPTEERGPYRQYKAERLAQREVRFC